MQPANSDACPIEPIPGIGPPQNLTPLTWAELRDASDAARRLGVSGPFICTNCLSNNAYDPSFFIEDAYAIAPASLFAPGQKGLVGACRTCAPKMHALQIADDRRAQRRRWFWIIVAVLGVMLLVALW